MPDEFDLMDTCPIEYIMKKITTMMMISKMGGMMKMRTKINSTVISH